MKYKTEVEVIQWTGDNTEEVIDFIDKNDQDLSSIYSITDEGQLHIEPCDTMRGRNLYLYKNRDYIVSFKRKNVVVFPDWQFKANFKEV